LKNGRGRRRNQSFLPAAKIAAVSAAGPEVISGILNFVESASGNLPGRD